MRERALAAGVVLKQPCSLLGHERTAEFMRLTTSEGPIEAGILVAADGLRSPLRRAFGLEASPTGQPRRFGLRQHFRIVPWSSMVEVSFAEGVEAYVTPAGPERVGVAFLWDEGHAPEPPTIAALLARFPALQARLGAAEPDSRPRGAGPLYQTATSRVSDRFALVGDAAGYIDALTGEGLSVALAGARALCDLLPSALAQQASARALAPYDQAWRRIYRHYSLVARAMLLLARRPTLRRVVIRLLARTPRLFRASLAWAVGAGPPRRPAAPLPPAPIEHAPPLPPPA
jgi:flavin-dependent dehydrogenase